MRFLVVGVLLLDRGAFFDLKDTDFGCELDLRMLERLAVPFVDVGVLDCCDAATALPLGTRFSSRLGAIKTRSMNNYSRGQIQVKAGQTGFKVSSCVISLKLDPSRS